MTDKLKTAIAAVSGYLEKAESVPGAVGTKFGNGPGGYMSYAHLRMVLEAVSTLAPSDMGGSTKP